MNIKKETIEKYRKVVEELIKKCDFKKGLEIASKYPLSQYGKNSFVITKTRLLNQYVIKIDDLSTLNSIEKCNPHYRVANKMILFFEPEVKTRFKQKSRFS